MGDEGEEEQRKQLLADIHQSTVRLHRYLRRLEHKFNRLELNSKLPAT